MESTLQRFVIIGLISVMVLAGASISSVTSVSAISHTTASLAKKKCTTKKVHGKKKKVKVCTTVNRIATHDLGIVNSVNRGPLHGRRMLHSYRPRRGGSATRWAALPRPRRAGSTVGARVQWTWTATYGPRLFRAGSASPSSSSATRARSLTGEQAPPD